MSGEARGPGGASSNRGDWFSHRESDRAGFFIQEFCRHDPLTQRSSYKAELLCQVPGSSPPLRGSVISNWQRGDILIRRLQA